MIRPGFFSVANFFEMCLSRYGLGLSETSISRNFPDSFIIVFGGEFSFSSKSCMIVSSGVPSFFLADAMNLGSLGICNYALSLSAFGVFLAELNRNLSEESILEVCEKLGDIGPSARTLPPLMWYPDSMAGVFLPALTNEPVHVLSCFIVVMNFFCGGD